MAPSAIYTSVPNDENSKEQPRLRPHTRRLFPFSGSSICVFSCLLTLTLISFGVGFHVGRKWDNWASRKAPWEIKREDGLVDPQVIIGAIPRKELMFHFPSGYEDEGTEGDKIWNHLMPLGSGFLRVPHPRRYAMPRSKKVENDIEEAEIYSVSMTHQLHCLGVIRDIITKYSKGDKSRFAGVGHEYHCLDYIRQAVLCAGDTTLDHAEIKYNADGSELKYGFTGANATHRCRDWETIKEVLIEKRLDNKTGILF